MVFFKKPGLSTVSIHSSMVSVSKEVRGSYKVSIYYMVFHMSICSLDNALKKYPD